MGVSKFYRWISERYPCISTDIKEHTMPEFDNLYLDLNGIIHSCSHPNANNPYLEITEENIFSNIRHYIDFLFKMIMPQKVFFMAVDGVAPRAKMNQQRCRRFRSAREAEKNTRESGETLPTHFDINCISPGTAFMARLHEVLKNFIEDKIANNEAWRNLKIYLSGHETPGEGEHKIMDFIRYERSQENYAPNTKHCFYGSDADLIILGLCSHEPNFCVLREELSRKQYKSKHILRPESKKFSLVHLSLLREYLEHEFQPVKCKINFAFNLENIIDDFVVMTFLLGNDFIPHLPHLHIHENALPLLFSTYIGALPSLGGYINEDGHLNLERFEKFLKKLAEFEYQKFGRASDPASPAPKRPKTDLAGSVSNDKSADFELKLPGYKKKYYREKLLFNNITSEVLQGQAEEYVKAIQWNLHYYYNGVASWSWYYKQHYAPFIPDVKDFKEMNLDFVLDEPFLPFQQLLAVLPSFSKDLLPPSYQKLMVDKDSPIISFYPLDFETDRNGKMHEWEAVVVIPFINDELLLKCAADADKTLTSDELKRNVHSPHLLYTYHEVPVSSASSFLPSNTSSTEHHANCQDLNINLFRLPVKSIKKGLCDGVRLDTYFPGFPTLKYINHTANLHNEDVKVFHTISQEDNMMLTITQIVSDDVREVANSLLGKDTYVNWPYLVKANVSMVSNIRKTFVYENSNTVEKDTNHDEWISTMNRIKAHYCRRLGVYLGDVQILFHAKSPSEESVQHYSLNTVVTDI